MLAFWLEDNFHVDRHFRFFSSFVPLPAAAAAAVDDGVDGEATQVTD